MRSRYTNGNQEFSSHEEYNMLVAIGAAVSLILGFIFSLAKASSRAEKATSRHREELLARKQTKSDNENKNA